MRVRLTDTDKQYRALIQNEFRITQRTVDATSAPLAREARDHLFFKLGVLTGAVRLPAPLVKTFKGAVRQYNRQRAKQLSTNGVSTPAMRRYRTRRRARAKANKTTSKA